MSNRFNPGKLYITPGAIDAMDENNVSPLMYFAQHLEGDWGDLDEEDKKANEAALTPGKESRLLSAYHLPDSTKIWIITEWDRSATTILLPEEY